MFQTPLETSYGQRGQNDPKNPFFDTLSIAILISIATVLFSISTCNGQTDTLEKRVTLRTSVHIGSEPAAPAKILSVEGDTLYVFTSYTTDLIKDIFVGWEVQSKIAHNRLLEIKRLEEMLVLSDSIAAAEARKCEVQAEMIKRRDDAITDCDAELNKEIAKNAKRMKRRAVLEGVLGAAIPVAFLGGMAVGIYVVK